MSGFRSGRHVKRGVLRPFLIGEAEAERLRQLTLRERSGREAVGLPLNELAAIIEARKKLAEYGKSIRQAADFYIDHLERIRRCNVSVSELAQEVLTAKRKDGRSPIYLADLRNRLAVFCLTFGTRPIAGIPVEEIDDWLRD